MHRFYKYQGTGNDFIIFDNRDGLFDRSDERLIKRLCDRNFGIGADGLMLLQDAQGYDFEMVYFNSDGREGSMCGNGGRCIVAFAHRLGLFEDQTRFIATDGEHIAFLSELNKDVKLKMIDVTSVERDGEAYILNTGSPHYVLPVIIGLEQLPVVAEAKKIRYNETYAEIGVNVNFVQPPEGAGNYAIRTYERGVEDETLACGTGATAGAIAMAIRENLAGPIRIPISTLGGQLTVSFYRNGDVFTDVYLEGPAKPVFEGLVDLDLVESCR